MGRRSLLMGPPQSGRTRALIGAYLDHLKEHPLAERAFLVPEVSQREYIRALLAREEPRWTIPAAEVTTLPEFLHGIAERKGLVRGLCLSSSEELALIYAIIRDTANPKGLMVEPTLDNSRVFRNLLTTLRHGGLYLNWLMNGGVAHPKSNVSPIVALLLDIAGRYFEYISRGVCYDGLHAQERAVLWLLEKAGRGKGAEGYLASFVAVDGFYDAFYLYRQALRGLSGSSESFLMSLPSVPGDAVVRRFCQWALSTLGGELVSHSDSQFIHRDLLTRMARVTLKNGTTTGVRLLEEFTAGRVTVKALRTYVAEAQFIAEKILDIHRREKVPLEEFMVVVRNLEDKLVRAFRLEFYRLGIPLIVPVAGNELSPIGRLVASALEFAWEQSGESSRKFMTQLGQWLVKRPTSFFREIYRYGAFLNPEICLRALSELGEDRALTFVNRVLGLSKEVGNESQTVILRGIRSCLEDLVEWERGRVFSAGKKVWGRETIGQEVERIKGLLPSLILRGDGFKHLSAGGSRVLLDYYCRAFEELAKMPGDREVGGVYLVDAITARQWQKQYVFVAQVNGEHFPARSGDALGEIGAYDIGDIVQVNSPSDIYDFEYSLFLSALCRSRQATMVTYALRDFEGRGRLVSPFLYPLFLARDEGSVPDAEKGMGTRRRVLRRSVGALRVGGPGLSERVSRGIIVAEKEELARIFRVGDGMLEHLCVTIPDFCKFAMSFSATELSDYRKCPYLFLARRLVRDSRDLESLEDAVTELDIGVAAHEALKEAIQKYPDPVDVAGKFTEELTCLVRKKKLAGLFDVELNRVKREWSELLLRFYKREIPRLMEGGYKPWKCEWKIKMPFELTGVTGVALKGKLDRVDVTGSGCAVVYDYKSSSSDAFGRREGVELRALVEVAPLVYLYLLKRFVEQETGEPSEVKGLDVKPRFYYILLGSGGEMCRVALEASGGDPWAGVEQVLASTLDGMVSGRFHRAPHPCQACDDCRYYAICRRDSYREVLESVVEGDVEGLRVRLKTGGDGTDDV